METIMTKGFGIRDYAAGKTRPAPKEKSAKSPDETILRNPRNDPETDAP
jgi:hypothetical protein